jgi:predicted N-acyltransferase
VLSGALRQAGYESAVLAAQCPMIMQWPSFGEYVASLTKRWRRNVRQELRAFDAAGLKLAVFGAEELTGRIDDLAPLYANLQFRYGHDPGLAEARATLEWIVSRFAGATRVVAVLDGDRVLAFHLLFLARGAIYTYITGQTYDERARSTFSYFHATYYEPVRMAMETGAGWIDFGIESYPAKLARGCQVRPLAGFFRPSSGIPGPAARYLELLDLGLRARFRQLGRPLPAGAIPGPGASA